MKRTKEEVVKVIRAYKHIGLPQAIKVYNEMTEKEIQQFLETVAAHTINY